MAQNTKRANALAKRRAKPKYALGELVVDPYGELGVVDAIFADLSAAEDHLVVSNAKAWLAGLEKRPKTKPNGLWYSVLLLGEGSVLVGELDLRRGKR